MRIHFTLAAIFLEICMFVHVKSHPARPTLPLCWKETSARGNERELLCVIHENEHLDYDEIRTYAKDLNVKVNVSITCLGGGLIRLPWPFAAKNVVSLHVSGCTNEGLLSERKLRQPDRNELRQVVLENIRHRVNLSEIHDSIVNFQNMSDEYNCGPNNAVVQIYKNIDYVFPRASGSFEELIMMQEMMSASTVEQLITSVPVCKFPNLRYLENSGSRSFSAFHLKLIESNQYPNLKVYSLRNNSLGTIPSEISTGQLNFLPSLSLLDLSNNELTSADAFSDTISQAKHAYKGRVTTDLFSGKLVKNKKLLINLRKNNIRTLSHELVVNLVKSKSVILDIRDNPLECTCDLFSYGEHLAKLRRRSAATIYKQATCQHIQQGKTTQHLISDQGFGTTLCEKINVIN